MQDWVARAMFPAEGNSPGALAMNWAAVIAFGIPWLLLGMRILEADLPAAVRLRRPGLRALQRERL